MSTATHGADTHTTARPTSRPAPGPAAQKVGGVLGWFDDRTGLAKPVRYLMNKVFPDHWSFMLGEVTMYSMVVALITGVFLTMWFVPSTGQTVYHGSYVGLNGQQMSEAYKSALDISFDVKGGLLMRQIHHWSANFFIAAMALHSCRIFFTGAFRKPREINWVIGTVLLLLACIEGYAGYSLPDDLLSGTGIRVMEGFVQSAPIVGSYLAYFIFDGAFPGEAIVPRLFIAHVLIIPAILVGLVAAHLVLVVVHKHTQFPGPGRTNENVVGFPIMPVYAAKAGGFFFIVFGIIALASALVMINPIWAYGPYDPSPVTADVQPDWYMGFADGALRLLPGWLEFPIFGHPLSLNLALGSIVLLPVAFGLMGAYPFFEAWVTGDKREHHLLDRPRNAPTRTAIGMAAITCYFVMFLAAGNDLMAVKMGLSINDITHYLRALFFIGPIIAFVVTKRICLALQRQDRELALHGRETGRIVATPEGRFFEAHEPLDEYKMWSLVDFESPTPIEAPAGASGKAGKKLRRRAAWSRFYFSDRIAPVTPAELAAAHHDGHGHEALESGHGDHDGTAGHDGHGAVGSVDGGSHSAGH